MPTYTYGGITIRSNTDLTPEELDQAFDAYKRGADTIGKGSTVTRVSNEPEMLKGGVEPAINPVEEAVTFGMGSAGGAGLMKALSQIGRRARFSGAVGEDIASAIGRAAPEPMKPATAGIEGVAQMLRGGGGKAALQKSRQEGLGALYNEILAAEQSAVSDVPGKAERFKQLVTELADANRAAYNPVTADARTGALSLRPQRERAAILEDLKNTFPGQWERFQGIQNEYARGSNLLRLGKAKETGKDVLQDRGALQRRAAAMQDKLPPELLNKILPGGPLQTDKQFPGLGIPLLNTLSPIPLPSLYWRSAGPSKLEDLLTILGGTSGGALSEYLRHE